MSQNPFKEKYAEAIKNATKEKNGSAVLVYTEVLEAAAVRSLLETASESVDIYTKDPDCKFWNLEGLNNLVQDLNNKLKVTLYTPTGTSNVLTLQRTLKPKSESFDFCIVDRKHFRLNIGEGYTYIMCNNVDLASCILNRVETSND